MVNDIASQPRVAVDTESNSLHAFREQVCLLQFSTSEADYLVDPLALDDLDLLAPIFADPKIEKIFHAAEYDLTCLRFSIQFCKFIRYDACRPGAGVSCRGAG
jgi:ribonuclease D